MTVKDMCIGLYNISLKLDCTPSALRKCRRVCPDRKSLEYLCYLYDRGDSTSAHCYELKICSKNGELKVQPELSGLPMCQDAHWKLYDVIYFPKEDVQGELEAFGQLPISKKGYLVQLVSMLQTTMVMYQDWEVGPLDVFISFGVDSLNPEGDLGIDMLMEKFWNIAYVLVDGIVREKSDERLVKALAGFLQSLEKIYADRACLCQQFRAYTEEIAYGLEKKSYSDEIYSTRRSGMEGRCLSKEGVANTFDFLFLHNGTVHPYGNVFSELAAVLRAFLEMYNLHKKAYSEEILGELLGCLQRFAPDSKEITSIAGLEDLTLESKTSITADAKRVLDYMMNLSKRKRIRRYRRTD